MKKTGLILLSFVYSVCSLSQETEMNGLASLSLEDLMNLTISGASKKQEKITDAPSIITTITQDEIQKFGGNNLTDVLKRAASVYDISSISWRQSTVAIRGDLNDEINRNILFLINGRPFRESSRAGLNAALLTSFPLSYIQQIEIIRGPGSILHGTGAFTAVINVVTKDESYDDIEFNLKHGSFGTSQAQLAFGTSIKEIKVNGAVNAFHTDGWVFNRLLNNTTSNVPLQEDLVGANIGIKYKGFTANGFGAMNDFLAVSTRANNESGYLPTKIRKIWADVGYIDTLFSEKYVFQFNATYNNSSDESINQPTEERATDPIQGLYSKDYLLELINFYHVSEKIDVTFGGAMNIVTGEEQQIIDGEVEHSIVEKYNENWYRGYAQADYAPTDWLSVIAGVQFNKVPDVAINFSPRLALVSNFGSSGFGAKLLYGQAFRSASAVERGFIRPSGVVLGQIDLAPETVATFEPQLFYASSKSSFSVNYFHSQAENLIRRNDVYENTSGVTSQGYEFEGKYSPFESLYLTGSFTYHTNVDSAGNNDIYALPKIMAKLGASYDFKSYASLSIFNTFNSKTPIGDVEVADSDRLSEFNWMTAKININVGEILKFKQSVQVWGEVVNALDEEVFNYVFAKGATKIIQQTHPGRAFYIGASVRF